MKQLRTWIQNSRDPEVVMALLGLAQAIGFAAALILADGQTSGVQSFLSFLRGATMGPALSFGLMGVAHNAPRMTAKKAQVIAYISMVCLMVVSPFIMAPAIQAGIPSEIADAPWLRWMWAVAIAVAPDFVAVAIAVSSKAPPAEKAEKPAQSTAQSDVSAHSPRTRCEVPGCKMDYATVGGKGGHYKKHHPDLIKKGA